MNCRYCQNNCIKKGIRATGKQCYQCKNCKKYQQLTYTKAPISQKQYNWVLRLHNEGNSLSGIGRLLHISVSSVQRVITRLVGLITKPIIQEKGKEYEMDELCTFCGKKRNRIWVIYSINRKTKQIVDFIVGGRTLENIRKVVNSVLTLNPKCIFTDKLNMYPSLIEKNRHRVHARCTNHIERKNLTLRTWLRRLNRKTICFSRSENMLYNSMFLLAYGWE